MTYMPNKLTKEFEKWGLDVNPEKTRYLVIVGNGQDIELESGNIRNVKYYEYLGIKLSEDGRDDDKELMKK